MSNLRTPLLTKATTSNPTLFRRAKNASSSPTVKIRKSKKSPQPPTSTQKPKHKRSPRIFINGSLSKFLGRRPSDVDEFTDVGFTSDMQVNQLSHTVVEAASRSARRRSLSGNNMDDMVLTPERTTKKAVYSNFSPDQKILKNRHENHRQRSRSNSRSLSPSVSAAARRCAKGSPGRRRLPAKDLNSHLNANSASTSISSTGTTNTIDTIDTTDTATPSNEIKPILSNYFDNTPLDSSLKTYRLSYLSDDRTSNIIRSKLMNAVTLCNNNVNDNIKKVLLDKLMKIFSTIKLIEIYASAKTKKGAQFVEKTHINKNEHDAAADDDDDDTKNVRRLEELYQEQRTLTLNMGVTSDEIMIAALAVMQKICKTDNIKNVPTNLPKHNPFQKKVFISSLLQWQKDQPSLAGRLINKNTYLSGVLYYVPPNKSFFGASWLLYNMKKTKKIKWKAIKLKIEQKMAYVYSGQADEFEILFGDEPPLFTIELHNKIILSPIKVFANSKNDEKLSLSLIETDIIRLNNDANGSEQLIQIGSQYPLQFTLLTNLFQSIINSFH
jgi:hypothetical protein